MQAPTIQGALDSILNLIDGYKLWSDYASNWVIVMTLLIAGLVFAIATVKAVWNFFTNG